MDASYRKWKVPVFLVLYAIIFGLELTLFSQLNDESKFWNPLCQLDMSLQGFMFLQLIYQVIQFKYTGQKMIEGLAFEAIIHRERYMEMAKQAKVVKAEHIQEKTIKDTEVKFTEEHVRELAE